ncbi:hypothetical protein TSOC111612_11430 [Tsukamurella ocularis]|uniref:hypothetical protein n=1 Tax=Tsukamurella ocularis TaxID=1970234 RepID=UPI0039EEFC08
MSKSASTAGIVTAVGGAVMVVGSFLTWMTFTARDKSGEVTSIPGVGAGGDTGVIQRLFDVPSPGVFVAFLGLVALVGAAFHFRPTMVRAVSSVPLGPILGGGAGVVALLTCTYYGFAFFNGPWWNFRDSSTDYKVSLGIGFWLVTAASIACFAVAVIPAKHWITHRGQASPLVAQPQAPFAAPPTPQQPSAPAPQQPSAHTLPHVQSNPQPPASKPYRPSWQSPATQAPVPQQATPPAQPATSPSAPTPQQPSSGAPSKKPYRPSY